MTESVKQKLVPLVVFAIVFFLMFGSRSDREHTKPRFHDKPYSFKKTVYPGAVWPKELSDAEINEMAFHQGDLYLATEKGLVRFDFDSDQAIRYQLHADMPFEWWRSMTISESKVVATTSVAQGSTGGTYAGSHVIDLDTLELRALERRITGQVFHKGRLYQLYKKKLLIREPTQDFVVTDSVELTDYVHKGCLTGAPLATNEAVWVPTWGRATSSGTLYSATSGECGLIKLPSEGEGVAVIKKGEAMSYHTTQSSFSDDEGLLLLHPTKTRSVSYFHEPDQSWQRVDSSSLAGALSKNYFWLSYRGAIGYLRNSSASRRITVETEYLENRYVSAIAAREASPVNIEVWIAYRVKNYDGKGHYSVESTLEKHVVDLLKKRSG
ncbi:MAG: hypothetical protein AAF431_15195 [Pseudomonadota bacterium]